MSCGCGTSSDSNHSCGSKASSGCESVNICGNSYKLSVFDWLSNVKNPKQNNESDYVEVRFKNDRKSFFSNKDNLPLHIGSVVNVEASPGHDTGVVSLTGELVKIQMKKKRFDEKQALKIYRLANQKDIDNWKLLREKEVTIKKEAKMIASRLNLDMKITDVEYQGDGAKATFYYTAESRIDFRQLIKDYAVAFRTKIDMKQIGFRQEAAKIGGIGSCGRELCCSSWLTDFRSVNTNAARYQQLSINPQKLAGQCGKLKCCLNYELDSYLDVLSSFPPSNTTLETEKGRAFCIKIDVFKKKMWFAYAENPVAWYDLDIEVVAKQISNNKKGIKAPLLEDLMSKEKSLEIKSIDLIQENKVDRFENKGRNKRSNHNNRNDKKGGSRNGQNPPSNNPTKSKENNINESNKPQNNTKRNPNFKGKSGKKRPTEPQNKDQSKPNNNG